MKQVNLPTPLIEPYERQLETLYRAIALSQGQFSLILAHCNDTRLQNQLAQRLQAICEIPIRELVLPESAQTLYSTIVASLGNEQPRALMVFGLESVQALERLIISANLVRDEFRKRFSFPLVLWVTDEVLRKLIRLAPDFESWAGVPIDFTTSPVQSPVENSPSHREKIPSSPQVKYLVGDL